MRVPLLLAALTLVSLVSAQKAETREESGVWESYNNLRGNDSIKLWLEGVDSTGRLRQPVRALLYWRLSVDPRTNQKTKAEVEIDIWETTSTGENLTHRIVGDGTTLYRYDVAKREVSTTQYGFYGPTAPADPNRWDARRLISQIVAVTPGHAAYLARLLSEVAPVGFSPAGDGWAAKFTRWDPGIHPALDFDGAWRRIPAGAQTRTGAEKKQPSVVSAADVLLDPITDARYVRGDGRSQWLFYRVEEDGPRQTMAVHLRDDRTVEEDPPYWMIDFWRIAKATSGRLLDLVLYARPEAPPDWAFIPYKGAEGASYRPVARGR